MYMLFKEKGILPSSSYYIKKGEQIIITAFLQEIIKERNEDNENISKMFEG